MSSCNSGNSSLFGPRSQFIKADGGNLIAVEGVNVVEKQMLSDLRIPYKQVLRSRIILKPGQVNYLLNFLGLGDNVTFLCIKSTYAPKSTIEPDNYVMWSYYNDFYRTYNFSQLMILTGNSTNRIQQIYLTNPNANYPVTLDVMTAVIDDQYSFFNDVVNQTGRSFVGLQYTDIHTYIIGQSIVINDKSDPPRPLIFITLVNIENVDRIGDILTIDDSSLGPVFLQFLTDFDAMQANSLINYIMNNPTQDIDELNPVVDLIPPVVFFNSKFLPYGDYIALNGSTASVPYNSAEGLTYSTNVTLSSYTASNTITKLNVLTGLVNMVTDNRDGIISLTSSNILVSDSIGNNYNTISATGSYIVTFNFTDIAGNSPGNIIVDLNVN